MTDWTILAKAACESLWGKKSTTWKDADEDTKNDWRTVARAVISKYLDINGGEAMGWIVKRNDGLGFYVIGHDSAQQYKASGYDVSPLFLAPRSTEVKLPDRSQLARIITQASSPVDAAQAVLELLKEKNASPS